MNWILLTQGRDKLWALLKTGMTFRVTQNAENFLVT
jgi:hypothetical protein